ncbi:MAG TPA: hypothetical protein VGK67_25730 [Myxococcales bacterium]|jgi:Flp pilus assembly pilin Flp
MMTRLNDLIRSEEGQGKTEYIIVVALIAIATIAVVTMFSQNVRALWASSSNSLGGSKSGSAKKGGAVSSWNHAMRKNLSNFGSNQHIGGGEGGWE